MTTQTAPEIIHKLVETFEQNLESYRSNKNETELRVNFLNPFFTALGWDVANEKGRDELGKEVTHEFSVDVAGQQKKADYAFRVGRGDKFDFLVEAKKPSVKIEFSQDAAFQIRRYGWSAKLPINILTDFEHFAVYDCRAKPSINDKASIGRIMLIHYKDYVEKWDEIVSIFSPEAARKGSFAAYAEGLKGKKGTADVDDAFLQEIERWREALAKNIALRNEMIDIAGLNYAVQMTIDRIVFLRICEERGIEPENQLLGIAAPPPPSLRDTFPKFDGTSVEVGGGREGVYTELCELFKRADTKYNSGLFHFKKEKDLISRPDDLTLTLDLDDKVLKDIISNLYYPKSPYAFLYIPSDILGQVYERFLGKVIRLTAGHSAKVEEKPEVRKAGGVYYTPTYIVEYIVKNTVGRLLENREQRVVTPADVAKLKIVDPACGSGTFLLGAYQFLLDWHLKWYVTNDPEKWASGKTPAIYQPVTYRREEKIAEDSDGKRVIREGVVDVKGEWKLTSAKKREILTNNIYGVDIDAQAVEVTKLSLLLKVLENSNGQLRLGMERLLPDLENNVKYGNSLIGFDYFEGQLLPNADEQARVNAFDWKVEFKDIFANGGFDAVIGNPPWGAALQANDEKYFRAGYDVAQASTIDSYSLFAERSIRQLRKGGFLGYIIPDTFLRKDELLPTRKFLLEKTSISELIETGPMFSQVRDTWCLILTTQNANPADNLIRHKKISRFITAAEDRLKIFAGGEWESETEVRQKVWQESPKQIVGYRATELEQRLIRKIETNPALGSLKNIFKISRGEEGSKFNIVSDERGSFEMVIPKNVARYFLGDGVKIRKKILTQTKLESLYTHPKIWIIRIQKMRWKQRIVCVFDESRNSAGMKTLQIVISLNDDVNQLKFLSALLSSKLINFWCINYLSDDMNQSYLERLPIRPIDFANSAEKAQHDKMVSLVEQMLAGHKALAEAKSPAEKGRLERQIQNTDSAIDTLVYELYGLNNEEIKIVEG